jgi:hypothetical protein
VLRSQCPDKGQLQELWEENGIEVTEEKREEIFKLYEQKGGGEKEAEFDHLSVFQFIQANKIY